MLFVPTISFQMIAFMWVFAFVSSDLEIKRESAEQYCYKVYGKTYPLEDQDYTWNCLEYEKEHNIFPEEKPEFKERQAIKQALNSDVPEIYPDIQLREWESELYEEVPHVKKHYKTNYKKEILDKPRDRWLRFKYRNCNPECSKNKHEVVVEG